MSGGHETDLPSTITCANILSHETVRVALTLAELNNLEVKEEDIHNAYISAPFSENVWTVLGPEFVEDADKAVLIDTVEKKNIEIPLDNINPTVKNEQYTSNENFINDTDLHGEYYKTQYKEHPGLDQ